MRFLVQIWPVNLNKRGLLPVSWLIFFIFFTTSCTVWRVSPRNFYEPPELPPSLSALYQYEKTPLDATLIRETVHRRYIFRQVELPLILPEAAQIRPVYEWQNMNEEISKTNHEESNDLKLFYTNRLSLYLPKKTGKRPLIVISPITGGNQVVDIFAKFFARHGYVAVIVERKKVFYDETLGPEQVEKYLRSSVIRIRQAIDWLATQPEVDPDQIGGFGISYGAVLHSVLAAVEPRIKFHILVMPAGELPDVILNCPESRIHKLVSKLEARGWPREKIHSELKRVIVTDPINFAPYVPKDRVVIYGAIFDRVVGGRRTIRLWKMMNRPNLKLMPFGHYGGIVALPYLLTSSLYLYQSHLK